MGQLRYWIEFHDSTVLSLTQAGADVEIVLDAYVHRWENRRNAWFGTGWSQPIRMAIKNVVDRAIRFEVPAGISCGGLRIGDVEYVNCVKLPLNSTEPIDLWLELADANLIEIVGSGLQLEAAGEARYIEDLPEDIRPNDTA